MPRQAKEVLYGIGRKLTGAAYGCLPDLPDTMNRHSQMTMNGFHILCQGYSHQIQGIIHTDEAKGNEAVFSCPLLSCCAIGNAADALFRNCLFQYGQLLKMRRVINSSLAEKGISSIIYSGYGRIQKCQRER